MQLQPSCLSSKHADNTMARKSAFQDWRLHQEYDYETVHMYGCVSTVCTFYNILYDMQHKKGNNCHICIKGYITSAMLKCKYCASSVFSGCRDVWGRPKLLCTCLVDFHMLCGSDACLYMIDIKAAEAARTVVGGFSLRLRSKPLQASSLTTPVNPQMTPGVESM